MIWALLAALHMLHGAPEIDVYVDPPRPAQQQYLFQKLHRDMWGDPKRPNSCRTALISSCVRWVTDA